MGLLAQVLEGGFLPHFLMVLQTQVLTLAIADLFQGHWLMKSLWLISWPHSKDAGQCAHASSRAFAIHGNRGIARVKPPIFPRGGGKIESHPLKYIFTKEGSQEPMSS